MRILYLSQYFPPEAGATQTRAFEMARTFVRLGHPVTMLAEIPNHPSGIIPPAFRGKLYERSTLDGIDVIRVWVKAAPAKNFNTRLLFYLSYMLSATLAGIFLARHKYDLVYCSSPPLFTGACGLALAWLKRIPFVFEVRDLWPESAVALGELSNPHFIRWAGRLEKACYHRARKVVVVTQGIFDRLVERGIPEKKLCLIPNGSNPDEFHFTEVGRRQRRAELGWDEAFIAIYAGIFGLAQGLETVLDAAHILRHDARFHFVLIGDGPKKGEIMRRAAELGLDTVHILPEQPRERMPEYLSCADVALVPLRRLELFKGALPSKIFDAWACERPVLLSIDGEARTVVEQAEGGLFVPPEDPQALSAALLELAEDPDGCQRMGQAGRSFTRLNYSRPALAGRLIDILGEEFASPPAG